MADISLNEGLGVGTVAMDAERIQGVLTALEHLLVPVDDHQIMAFRDEVSGDGDADLAGPDDQYPHRICQLLCFMTAWRVRSINA